MPIDDVQAAGRLLWGHIGGRTHRLPLHGKTEVARNEIVDRDRRIVGLFFSVNQLGQPPIENDDFAVVSQHDVLAFEITKRPGEKSDRFAVTRADGAAFQGTTGASIPM